MKRLFGIIAIFSLLTTSVYSQTYSTLWKQFDRAQEKDLPTDQLNVLKQISNKATLEKEYGQLLKAELQSIRIQAEIAPDSLPVQMLRYEQNLSRIKDGALNAVYCSTLGHIYKNHWSALDIHKDTAKIISTRYYKQSLLNVKLLASTKAKTYEPLLKNGANSTIFNNDLLHAIAIEAEEYNIMHDYYKSAGNRQAACMSAFMQTQKERMEDVKHIKKSKYLATLDSLIHEYQDLPEAGEIAIEHFNFMQGATDASAQEKMEYIKYALQQWGSTWPRMAILRNAGSRITLPSFHVTINETLTIPNRAIPVYLTSLTNLQQLNMSVYKVNITGADRYNPNNEEEYKRLKARMSAEPIFTDTRTYYGLPDYLEVRDTLTINPLPVGVYMVEFTSSNEEVAPERLMLNISNLRLVDMNLPENKIRLAVVDATTGKPVAKAKIRIKFREWKNRKWHADEQTLTTEKDGEVIFSSTLAPDEYLITTDNDKAFPWQDISSSTWNYEEEEENTRLSIQAFTDRAIYRPGQKAHVSIIAYNQYTQEKWETSKGIKAQLTLRDSKNKQVSQQEIVTDEWGVASTTFTLPENGNSGTYYVNISADSQYMSRCSFKVEEYKRPTFTVSIDEYKEPYKEGDTIIVKGMAKTYSGVAVQNAKVKYNVSKQFSWWWRNYNNSYPEHIHSGEAVTSDDGSFTMKVPVQFPDGEKKGNRFARLKLTATVTDTAGESHDASASYPISDKATAFVLSNFNEKQCREAQTDFKFLYLNSAGKNIDAILTYQIDGGEKTEVSANTNTRLNLSGLSSGQHKLVAICNTDTLKQNFIVFSLKDKTAPIDTAAWYYSTCGEVYSYSMTEGKSEFIQLGTSKADQTVFYAVCSDTTLLECGKLVLDKKLITREIKYKEEWGNGLAIRYTWVCDGKLYSYHQSFTKPVKEQKLNIEWKTFRDKLTPGQKEEWTAVIKNLDGTPAKAQMMAVMFDKALDALKTHNWSLQRNIYYNAPRINQYASHYEYPVSLYGEKGFKPLAEPSLEFCILDIPDFHIYSQLMIRGLTGRISGVKAMAKSMAMPQAMADKDELYETVVVENSTEKEKETEEETANIKIRENLNETAFFMPQLIAGKNGEISIKFTLPESLTTWKFMSIAHDKQMNIGQLSAEIIAQKELMVQPNMPRFIREGDKAELTTNIHNNSDKNISGNATMQIINPANDKVMHTQRLQFNVAGAKSTAVTFKVPGYLRPDVYICKITVQAGNYSDGEQHYLPVLSNKTEVTTSRAFTQIKPGRKEINIEELYGKNSTKESLKIEYTNNPAWLMIEALPVVANPDADNAISLGTALYANSITSRLAAQLPNDTTLNKTLPVSTAELTKKLSTLQNSNGSFSWFNGMTPSLYVTQSVAKNLARLDHFGLLTNRKMYDDAMIYLDKEIAEYVKELKKYEKKHGTKPMPSDWAMDYLYIQAVSGHELDTETRKNAEYLLSLLTNKSKALTIYGKANMAVVFYKHPALTDKKYAKELLESIRQYTVKTETMGRYFDTPKAYYSWCDYKIPTHTAAIEALQSLVPEDKQTIADMQQWLLQEKHTQQWNTPLNSASAIHVFFDGWNFKANADAVAKKTQAVEQTKLYVDNQLIAGGTKSEGKGYVTETLEGRHTLFVADKTSDNISWGAVYASCTQPMEDVEKDSESISVKREILDEKGNRLTGSPTVGSKIRIRITINAERDLDFVEVTDNRAACLEPINQLSGYRYGYYVTPKDNKTVYYFNKLAKGKHTIETEYYVDRAGTYKSGIVTAKCAYAPEFQARDKALTIEIK